MYAGFDELYESFHSFLIGNYLLETYIAYLLKSYIAHNEKPKENWIAKRLLTALV